MKNRSVGEKKTPLKRASYTELHIAFQVWFVRGLMESYTDYSASDKLKFPLSGWSFVPDLKKGREGGFHCGSLEIQ